jgi:hypothetical protein
MVAQIQLSVAVYEYLQRVVKEMYWQGRVVESYYRVYKL